LNPSGCPIAKATALATTPRFLKPKVKSVKESEGHFQASLEKVILPTLKRQA
jgi:hypothetical protein